MSDTPQSVVLFEMSAPSGVQQVSSMPNIKRAVEKATENSAEALENIKDTIHMMAGHTYDAVQGLGAMMPDEYELTFGLSIDVEGNVWVAKAAVNTSLTVTLKWNQSPPTQSESGENNDG